MDISESVISGDSFYIETKAKDFRITPFPLQPFAIDVTSSFNVELLMSENDDLSFSGNSDRLKFKIKPTSRESESLSQQRNQQVVDFEVVNLSENEFQIVFTPKLIERHFFEIYLDDKLINQGKNYK